MDLITYQKAAKRTMKDLSIGGSDVLNIAHMALGMASELSELEECMGSIKGIDLVNLSEELGDKMWYAAGYANFRNDSLGDVNFFYLTEKDSRKAIIVNGGKIADFAKRWLAYGQPIEKQKQFNFEMEILHLYVNGICNLCCHYDLDFEDVIGKNIVKLYVRYPEKFSDDQALSRDLENERLALEGKV